MKEIIKLIDDKRHLIPVGLEKIKNRLYFDFAYNEYLKDEIKAMEGSRWDPDNKQWHVIDNERNWFQLNYLMGDYSGYDNYDKELKDFQYTRDDLMEHQKIMFNTAMTRKKCLLACDMGTGKTLAGIEVIEAAKEEFGIKNWWWVGPKSANISVKLEFEKWTLKGNVKLMTYEGLRKIVEEHPETLSDMIPEGIVFDESSRLKSESTKRTLAASMVITAMNNKFEDPMVILLSGTPSPKSPADWYSQCELLCPGFIKEGTLSKFENRLALIVNEEDSSGNFYPRIVTWLDDENKCAICGQYKKAHDVGLEDHPFKKSVNEVAKLFDRLSGLVTVIKKEDCTDLPDKQYRTINCEPSKTTIRLMNHLKKKYPTVIQVLNHSRQLSDGFQYEIEDVRQEECPKCLGNKVITAKVYEDEDVDFNMNMDTFAEQEMVEKEIECFICDGLGEVGVEERVVKKVSTPKDDAFRDLLDEYSEAGRVVVFAGYTASVDRCVELAREQGWKVIRVDGRGWEYSDIKCIQTTDSVKVFQDKSSTDKIAFIGNPGSACFGLTLTASPVVIYYSNSFNGEHRMQSEDRIHRIGMDTNKGATIIDIIHLPTDQWVLDNLKQKVRLQDLTMGQLEKYLETEGVENDEEITA